MSGLAAVMMEKGGNIEQNIFTLVSALVGFRRMVEQQIPSASGLDFVKRHCPIKGRRCKSAVPAS